MMDERSGSEFIRIAVGRHIFDYRATVRVLDGRRCSALIVEVGFVEKVILLLCVVTGLLLQQPVCLVVVIVVVIAVVRRCRHLGTGLVSVDESLMLWRRTFQDFALSMYRRLWFCRWCTNF
jgi:hypothetical protein